MPANAVFSADGRNFFIYHYRDMNRIPFSLGALHAFEAAARLGSFKAAAAELALSSTAVSHRIRTLEAQLGKPLFERRTRAVVLTADGRLLAEAVSGSFAAIAEAAARIRRPERSRVILALTPEFARQWLVPRLAGFQAACPDVELHIRADYRTADLAAGEADLAVRYGGSDSAGIEAVPLFGETFAAAAAPALLSKLPAEPQNWPLLHLDWHKPQPAGRRVPPRPGSQRVGHRPARPPLLPVPRHRRCAVARGAGGGRVVVGGGGMPMTAARFCRNAAHAAVFNQRGRLKAVAGFQTA